MAGLPPRPGSPLRMPAREDRRHPPDDRDRLLGDRRRPIGGSRFNDRPPPGPGDRSYQPSRPRPDSYVAPPYDRDRRRDFDRDRSRDRRRDRSLEFDRDRDRSPPRRRSPDRDVRGYRGPPRRRFSPGRPVRPFQRNSRSPLPRRRISRSPPPFRGRPRSRSRSRSPYPPSPSKRMRLGNHSTVRPNRSRSPYRRRPSIGRSPSPPKRPFERKAGSPKEPGEHDDEMPIAELPAPEFPTSEAVLPPSSVPDTDIPEPSKEESLNAAPAEPPALPADIEEPPRHIPSPLPPDMDIIISSEGIQHPVSNERSSPITPPTQIRVERTKADASTPLSASYNRGQGDDTYGRDSRLKTESGDHKLDVKSEVKPDRLADNSSPKIEAKKSEEPGQGFESPWPPTLTSSQSHRSPSPKPPSAVPVVTRPLPTGPARGWGGRSPPRGPRSHIQRANAAPAASPNVNRAASMASPNINHNVPHPFTPRGPRRGGFQPHAPYAPTPSHFAHKKKNLCDPKTHEPPQIAEIDAELAKIGHGHVKLQAASEASSRAVYRALQELDMANIDLQAAESRRVMAEQQLEKAKSGTLGIDAVPFPVSPPS